MKNTFLISAIIGLTITTSPVIGGDVHINANTAPWDPMPDYAVEDYGVFFAKKSARFNTLIGDGSYPVRAKNVYFGVFELAPGAIYVGHKHSSPEIYYVISGEAEWTVDGKSFQAESGSAIYHKPNAVHRMVNIGSTKLRTLWMWWGNPNQMSRSKRVEPRETQPSSAVFSD
tara:strand:- start:86 stop:601 length:516 start_codon:yes stop_codon:yes gene_type:complete